MTYMNYIYIWRRIYRHEVAQRQFHERLRTCRAQRNEYEFPIVDGQQTACIEHSSSSSSFPLLLSRYRSTASTRLPSVLSQTLRCFLPEHDILRLIELGCNQRTASSVWMIDLHQLHSHTHTHTHTHTHRTLSVILFLSNSVTHNTRTELIISNQRPFH